MAITPESEQFIGSHEKANNGYGQNGYQGPSSDLPGQSTRANRKFGLPADPSAEPGDWQTRKVDATPYAPAHGMKSPDSKIDFPKDHFRKASIAANPKSFQR